LTWRKSSSIDLLEVDVEVIDHGLGPFFPGWIAFQNFLVADLELGEKKIVKKKKSQEASRAKWGPTFLTRSFKPPLLTLVRLMTNVFLSKCVNNNCVVCP
jgi:hypothetical protein